MKENQIKSFIKENDKVINGIKSNQLLVIWVLQNIKSVEKKRDLVDNRCHKCGKVVMEYDLHDVIVKNYFECICAKCSSKAEEEKKKKEKQDKKIKRCEYCLNKVDFFKEGFSLGGNKKRLFNWCSKECYEERNLI